MLILGQKGANLDQKGPKMGETRFFPTYRFASKDDTPYSATFGQISSKSNEAFSNYAQKTSSFTLIP